MGAREGTGEPRIEHSLDQMAHSIQRREEADVYTRDKMIPRRREGRKDAKGGESGIGVCLGEG